MTGGRNWGYYKIRVEKLRELLGELEWGLDPHDRLEAQSRADAMSAKLRELEPEYHFLTAHPEAIPAWEDGVPVDWLISFTHPHCPAYDPDR